MMKDRESIEQCLICCGKLPMVQAQHSQHQQKGDNEETISLLDKNLEVIWLLRKVLEVPGEDLARFLKAFPNNLEDWVKICGKCGELVKECKVVYGQLLEVNRRWIECRLKVVRIIKKNQEDEDGGDLEEMEVDIAKESRDFVKKNNYENWMNPFHSGDLKALQLANFFSLNHKAKAKPEMACQNFKTSPCPSPSSSDCNDLNYDDPASRDNEHEDDPESCQPEVEPKPIPKPSTSCHICGVTVKNAFLKLHLYNKHNLGTLKHKCAKCSKMFNTTSHLKRHFPTCTGYSLTRSHSDQAFLPPGNHFQIKCAVQNCNFTGKLITAYRIHLKSEHTKEERTKLGWSPKILECLTCGKMVAKSEAARIHVLEHDKSLRKELICEVCGTKFLTRKQLHVHQRKTLSCLKLQGKLSEEESKVICEICGGQYSNPRSLRRHVKSQHEKIYSHKCVDCGKGYRNDQMLKVHLAQKHGIGNLKELELKCTVEGCGRVFFDKRYFKDHLLGVHKTGEPGFKCEECGEQFYVRCRLSKHVKMVH